MQKPLDAVRHDARAAGAVKRWHTWPVLHGETVAEHSWNVLRILLQLFPDAPREVLVYVTYHDLGGVKTGDLPYPIKRDNPVLKETMDRIETESWREQGISCEPITAYWKARVKVCDMLDMWEFGIHDYLMGSCYARPIVAEVGTALAELTTGLLDHESKAVAGYMRWRVEMTYATRTYGGMGID